MRFLSKSVAYSSEDQPVSPRSVQSNDSFEIFGSACSDYSDCEYCDDRRKRYKQRCTPCSSASQSYRSAMSRLETAPLLGTSTPVPAYSSILPDSPDSLVSHSFQDLRGLESKTLLRTSTPNPVRSFVTHNSDSLGPGDLSASAILATYNKQFEKSIENDGRKKQSSLVTIFSVWNTIMGSSLLTTAWGVQRAGLGAALVLLVLMAALCLYTAHVLLRINRAHGTTSCEVPALCRTLLGPWAEAVAHTFSFVVLLGANVVYWILISNFLYFTVNYFVDLNNMSNTTAYNTSLLCPKHGVNSSLFVPEPVNDSPYWGLHTTVPVYVALIVFPLLNFRNVSFFTKFNSLGTLSVVYLLIFVIVKGYTWGINFESILADSHAGKDAAVLSGMLALSFYIHNIIITIMSNNAKQEKNGRDLTIAFALVTVTYTMVGVVFYICFPLAKSCIQDNILNNFEMHDVMTAVARILLLFQVVTVYPLVAFMLRSEVVLLLPLRESRRLTVAINALIVAACILVACFCPSIGTIIRYTGAVSGLVHIFALPSLLQLRSLQLRGELTFWKLLFYSAILLFGTVNLIMQFFIDE